MVVRVDWTVQPGEALGPFTLDQSLNSILRTLVNASFLNEACHISYDRDNPYEGDIIIRLEDSGTKLNIDANTHRLKRIDWIPAKRIREGHTLWTQYALMFDNKHMNSDIDSLDCKHVLSIFPPTTLGNYTDESLSYEVVYKQGISFLFDIKDKETFDLLLSRPDHPNDLFGYSPRLSCMSVYSRPEADKTRESKTSFEVYPGEGLRILFADGRRSFVELGSGLQGLFNCLGIPDSVHNEDIFNYYNLGLDFRMSETGPRTISQIVLHTNIPGSSAFGRYDRAWFRIEQKRKKGQDNQKCNITNESKLDELVACLGDPGQPLIIEETSGGVRHFYMFPGGLTFEINSARFITSLHISFSTV